MKGFSIITNFGCHNNCWYCIWKKHPQICVKNKTNWNKLEHALALFPQDKISISGGGDPLHNYENNQEWYERLFFLCEKYNKKIDVHTSYIRSIINKTVDVNRFNKFVVHVNYDRFVHHWWDLIDFENKSEKLRLVLVLTEELTISQVETLIDFAKIHNFQLSFREYVAGPEKVVSWTKRMHRILYLIERSSNNKIRFIDQDDYNVYFMPDNNIYTNFFCCKGSKIA